MIHYAQPVITEEDKIAVLSVLEGTVLTNGPQVNQFEADFCNFSGAKFAKATSSGSASLHIATLALGIGENDGVIVPNNTFFATLAPLFHVGAMPIIVDVDTRTGNVCAASIQQGLELAEKRNIQVKAIFGVHYAGLPFSSEEVYSKARENGLLVLEDACHAPGAYYQNIEQKELLVPVGTYSDVTIFSFHPTKHMTTGEGGMVTTNCQKLAEKVEMLRNHGIKKTAGSLWHYHIMAPAFNYRLSELNAALGGSQLKRMAQKIQRRREIAALYRAGLEGIPHIVSLGTAQSSSHWHVYHLYSVRITFSKIAYQRELLVKELRDLGIGVQVHYVPLSEMPAVKNNRALVGEVKNSLELHQELLSLPMHELLSDEQVHFIVEKLRKLLS